MSIRLALCFRVFAFALLLCCPPEELAAQSPFPPPRPFAIFDGVITGNPSFPFAESSDGIFFAADNRRMYQVQSGSAKLAELGLPRRVAGALEPVWPGLAWFHFSDGTSQLFEGLRPVGIRMDSPDSSRPSGGFSRVLSLEYPGQGRGAKLISDQGRELLELLPVPTQQHPEPELRARVLGPSQALIQVGTRLYGLLLGGPPQLLSQSQGQLPFRVRLADRMFDEFIGADSLWRLFELPVGDTDSIEDVLAFYPPARSQREPLSILRSGNGIRVQSFRGELLPETWQSTQHSQDSRVQFRGAASNGYLVFSSSNWHVAIYRLDPAYFDLRRDDDLSAFYTALLQLRSPSDSYLSRQLSDAAGRASLLASLDRRAQSGELLSSYLAFRIITLPTISRSYVTQAQRLAALDAFVAAQPSQALSAALLAFLEYEYDVDFGLAIVGKLLTGVEDIVWSRMNLLVWLQKSLSAMNDSSIANLLAWYASLKDKLAPSLLFSLFDNHFWERLLQQSSSNATRESILRR